MNVKLAQYKDSAVSASEAFDKISSIDTKFNQVDNYKNAMIGHFETWLAKKQMPYSINELDAITDKLNDILSASANLTSIGIKASEIENKFNIMSAQNRMITAKSVYSDKINDIAESVTNDEDCIAKANRLFKGISDKYSEICRCEDKVIFINEEIEAKQNEYREALLSAGVCPTCGQLIDSADTDKLSI